MIALLPALLLGVAPPALARAEKAMDQLDFSAAAKELANAAQEPGLDRASLLRILELTGEVDAQRGERAPAVAAFRELLFLEPRFTLDNRWGPKVRLVFLDARDWVSQRGQAQLTRCDPTIENGSISQLCVNLGGDPLQLFRAVRFHLQAPNQPDLALAVPVNQPGQVRAPVPPSKTLSYWAELLGEREAQLVLLGDPAHPLQEKAPELAPTPKPPPVIAAATPEPSVAAPAPEPQPRFRALSYTLGAIGVAALGGGTYFGLQAHSDESTFDSAPRDSSGRITGLTQRDAFALGDSSSSHALAANVLLGVGAAALVAGVVTFIVGSR